LLNYGVIGNGPRPPGYHWGNLALHAVNVALVYAYRRIIPTTRCPCSVGPGPGKMPKRSSAWRTEFADLPGAAAMRLHIGFAG
jgi:hypothetical protein